ncbi:MAG: hypothetical protein KOO63_02460 [Bacteroidales bacterium]|nr:hypothetical protein [Candidatus Latescibacterota bacterium]
MIKIGISYPGRVRSVFLKKVAIVSIALIMAFSLTLVAASGRAAADENDKRTKRKDHERDKDTRNKKVDPERTRDRKERDEHGRRSNDEVKRPRRLSVPNNPSVPRRPRKPKGPRNKRIIPDPPGPYTGFFHHCVRHEPKDFNLGHVEIIIIDHYWPGIYDEGYDSPPDSYIEGLFDENSFFIALPFGSILPWEVGEDFLIWLRSLEDGGQEQSSLVCIIQMMEPGDFDDFLTRFGREDEEMIYYDTLSDRSFLVAAPVMTISRLLSDTGIRWIGEYRDEYKIVPGENGLKIYISSLEGDRDEFRSDLETSGLTIEDFREITGEYIVQGGQDIMLELAGLWWIGRISGRPSRRIRYSDDYGMAVPEQ